MKKIADGVFQLVCPFPQYSSEQALHLRDDLEAHPRATGGLVYVLPYLIQSAGDTMIVDCGWNTEQGYAALADEMNAAGSNLGDLSHLMVTHAHVDHCGLMGRLKAETGCQILMHTLESDYVQDRYIEANAFNERVQEWLITNGMNQAEIDELLSGSAANLYPIGAAETDRRLEDGDVVTVGEFIFEIIWTPGHSPGHICIYEPNHRFLLTGDHVLPTISPNISHSPSQLGNPLKAYITSLDKIADLKVNRMLPAHQWDIATFKSRVQELRSHHHTRVDEVHSLLAKGFARTGLDVARELVWMTGSYEKLPPTMKRAALGEALAHLMFLVDEGAVNETSDRGVTYFSAL